MFQKASLQEKVRNRPKTRDHKQEVGKNLRISNDEPSERGEKGEPLSVSVLTREFPFDL